MSANNSNKDTIEFCDAVGPYACFSNYYEAKIVINGKEYPSTEHYFQVTYYTVQIYLGIAL